MEVMSPEGEIRARQVFETVRCVFLLCRCQLAAVLVGGESIGRL